MLSGVENFFLKPQRKEQQTHLKIHQQSTFSFKEQIDFMLYHLSSNKSRRHKNTLLDLLLDLQMSFFLVLFCYHSKKEKRRDDKSAFHHFGLYGTGD